MSGLNFWFIEPVEGIDPIDEAVVRSTRHRLPMLTVHVHDDRMLFVDSAGVVVTEWPIALIERLEFSNEQLAPDQSVHPGTTEWRAMVQANHPKAYERWTPDEDAELERGYAHGLNIAELAELHERRPGAISARLSKLGLGSEDDSPPAAESAPSVIGDAGLCRHDLLASTCSICKHTTSRASTSPRVARGTTGHPPVRRSPKDWRP